jgi:hypothetical protein
LYKVSIGLIFCTVVSSCEKFVAIDPPVSALSGENIYTTDATAISAVTSIYNNLSGASASSVSPTFQTTSLYVGLSADEFTLWSGISNAKQLAYYKNSLSISPSSGSEFWGLGYPQIYICNAAIEGLAKSSSLTPSVKQQLMGEVKLIRSLYYFYLVNLYGDVPLVMGTDYTVNIKLPRASKATVYQQIISDLIDAQKLLSPNFLDGNLITLTTERIRPTKWAATALLARAYLFSGDYLNAEAQSTSIINQSSYSLVTLDNAFLKNNAEVIWQLQPVLSGWNTLDARTFILSPTGPSSSKPAYLSSFLLNAFEAGDNRKIKWVNSYTNSSGTYYYPYKYKNATLNAPVTEYQTLLRLAEQYLIRAEAEANGAGGGIPAAIADLNKIRNRAGLTNYSGPTDKASVINVIIHERQVELFSEWGMRWLDLNRTKTVDAVMSAVTQIKGGTWQTTDQLYPISITEIQKNPNLVQNPGY